MSSNMYGFTCTVPLNGRTYYVQVVYKGTRDDSEESLSRATAGWETEDPVALAKHELEHRDWSRQWHSESRISVNQCWGGWLDSDPSDDYTWTPPVPSEWEILEAIALGRAESISHGWDT